MIFRVCLVVAMSVPALAHATPEPPASSSLVRHRSESSARCATLWGSLSTRRKNRERRRALLRYVDQTPHAVTLQHRGTWRDATEISFDGLALLEAHPGVARLHVEPALAARFGCSSELQELHVDDAIGHGARILAILEGVVLLEYDRALRYWIPAGSAPPRISIGWSSTWSIRRKTARRK